jgi:hypothetical protein
MSQVAALKDSLQHGDSAGKEFLCVGICEVFICFGSPACIQTAILLIDVLN